MYKTNTLYHIFTLFTYSHLEIEPVKCGSRDGRTSLAAERSAVAEIIDGLNSSSLISKITKKII